jgi:F-box interacting protein
METTASIKGTGDNELPSSVHEVLSSEDLLIEIFLRLPLTSLHLSRSVSKLWLSHITFPNFIMRWNQIPNHHPTSGLLLRGSRSSDEYDFLPLDIRIPADSYRLHAPLEGSTFRILDSCNGLLLCCANSKHDVYVYNPSIHNMFKMLPECDGLYLFLDDSYGGLKMAFDPTKSPYYKVVNAQSMYSHVERIRIHTYSSKTGNWSVYKELFIPEDFESFYEGIYWNDAIHWLNWSKKGQILHHKLDVEHQGKKNILTHLTLDDTMNCDYCRLFQSRGCLLLVTMIGTPVPKLNVYEMTNDDSRWSVKYFVTLDEGWRSMPTNNIRDSFGVLSINLGEREEDSFLVMFLDGKVVRYNFVSRNVSTLTNYRSSGPPPFSFEFIASFARV